MILKRIFATAMLSLSIAVLPQHAGIVVPDPTPSYSPSWWSGVKNYFTQKKDALIKNIKSQFEFLGIETKTDEEQAEIAKKIKQSEEEMKKRDEILETIAERAQERAQETLNLRKKLFELENKNAKIREEKEKQEFREGLEKTLSKSYQEKIKEHIATMTANFKNKIMDKASNEITQNKLANNAWPEKLNFHIQPDPGYYRYTQKQPLTAKITVFTREYSIEAIYNEPNKDYVVHVSLLTQPQIPAPKFIAPETGGLYKFQKHLIEGTEAEFVREKGFKEQPQ